MEERSRGLLGRAFSRVFNHLWNTFPNFDFDAAIAPVPQAIRGDLARWVEDNVDALVRAFASEGDVVDDGDGGVAEGGDGAGEDDDDASDASEGDVASDIYIWLIPCSPVILPCTQKLGHSA